MTAPPFTDWDSVPLVCDITTTARVLGRSRRCIYDDLADGTMLPAPLPRRHDTHGGRWQWSKVALQRYLEGGYLRVVQRKRA